MSIRQVETNASLDRSTKGALDVLTENYNLITDGYTAGHAIDTALNGGVSNLEVRRDGNKISSLFLAAFSPDPSREIVLAEHLQATGEDPDFVFHLSLAALTRFGNSTPGVLFSGDTDSRRFIGSLELGSAEKDGYVVTVGHSSDQFEDIINGGGAVWPMLTALKGKTDQDSNGRYIFSSEQSRPPFDITERGIRNVTGVAQIAGFLAVKSTEMSIVGQQFSNNIALPQPKS